MHPSIILKGVLKSQCITAVLYYHTGKKKCHVWRTFCLWGYKPEHNTQNIQPTLTALRVGLNKRQSYYSISTLKSSFLDRLHKNQFLLLFCRTGHAVRTCAVTSQHSTSPVPQQGPLWSPYAKSSSTKTQKMRQTVSVTSDNPEWVFTLIICRIEFFQF